MSAVAQEGPSVRRAFLSMCTAQMMGTKLDLELPWLLSQAQLKWPKAFMLQPQLCARTEVQSKLIWGEQLTLDTAHSLLPSFMERMNLPLENKMQLLADDVAFP